ncbi:hypothetical protein EV122DRAFT_280286 [Schizophyllum commune]
MANPVWRVLPPPPEPEVIDDEQEWEVQEIVDSKWYRGALKLKIWFKGFPRTDAEWLPAHDADNALDKVRDFYHLHPNAAGRDLWFRAHPADPILPFAASSFSTLCWSTG